MAAAAAVMTACGTIASAADRVKIERIWLTHQTHDPGRLVVNWETDEPGGSVVEFGVTPAMGERVAIDEMVTLHHVEIPLSRKDVTYHYRVRTGPNTSAVHRFKGYPTDELRVAIVANTGYGKRPWADAVIRAKPHLLLTAGDNVPKLHTGKPVPFDTTTAFSRLVDHAPALYRSVPWLPALGNHDREIRPRGPMPPADPVYDVDALAFRRFFALPGDEWKWRFDVPDFDVRFIALDLSHLRDYGTTWQASHAYHRDGPQFGWYRDLMERSRQPFVITIYNEMNAHVRRLEDSDWGRLISRGSLAITGYGYFGERAEVDGFTYYNTSVNGTGSRYPDPKSVVLHSEDNFLLLTFRHEPAILRVDLHNLSGEVLDSKRFIPSPTGPK